MVFVADVFAAHHRDMTEERTDGGQPRRLKQRRAGILSMAAGSPSEAVSSISAPEFAQATINSPNVRSSENDRLP